ncbi:TolC family protein [Azospirillum melinis]|uniref:TolC family protein n=2 Tax=Azospirillum TaxID=191 RepID=A0ABX2K9E2_9PROT|nr:TolC family protein [Azospirillum melinis]MBP2306289.1 outer membrane protein TolC [Azospirillum melinis]NUB00230.1 TolC family protein [Azospirillum melinis]
MFAVLSQSMTFNEGKAANAAKSVGAAILLSTLITGCAIAPKPLTSSEMSAVVSTDRAAIEKSTVAISGSITLEEAVARALKQNLDYRTRLMEQSLAAGQLDASKYDMLPRLLTSAGYTWRDKENIRDSIDSVTGAPSLANPSISTDRTRATADIGLSWSILDFGVSYYNANQNADRLLVANERRRKAMHLLIQNVRTTYWRALAAQRLRNEVQSTIQEAERALTDSRKMSADRIRSPAEPLRYQRNLLENLRLLENVDRELAVAEIELATLIGAKPGSRIRLVEPDSFAFKALSSNVEKMEEVALLNNADLREQVYSTRIAAVETRKALLKLLPNLSFDYGYKYDGDKYLINQVWQEAGSRVAFNLFNLLSGPAQIRAAEMNVTANEAKRMALQMAVLSQLHLARYYYDDALKQYNRAIAISDVDNKLAELARSQEQSEMGGSLERVSANVTAILSSLRLYHSVAKVNEAISRIQASLGQEPDIGALDDITLDDLKQKLHVLLQDQV